MEKFVLENFIRQSDDQTLARTLERSPAISTPNREILELLQRGHAAVDFLI